MSEGGEREVGYCQEQQGAASGPRRGASGLLNIAWIGCGLCPTTSASVSCDSFNGGFFVRLFHRRSNFRNITNLPELKVIKAVGFPPTSTQSLSKG